MLTRHITESVYHPIRSLNLVVSALALLLTIYASVFSWQSWQDEKRNLIYDLQNIMTLEERAVDAYFSHLERDMLALGVNIIGTDEQIDIEHTFTLVKQFSEGHTELFDISVIRDDGQILFAAEAPPGQTPPTFVLEPSFQKFRNEIREGQPVSIGQPYVCSIHNEWTIPFRYVISNKEGKLKYIISANLPIGMLQNYWKDAPFTKIGALGLIRDDGFLVGRYPVPEEPQLEEIYGIPRKGTLITYLMQHQFPQNGYVRGPSILDGPDYLNSFYRLEHFPITLFIATPMSEIRTEWWNKVKVPYLLTVVLFVGGFFVYRLTLQRERTREAERIEWERQRMQIEKAESLNRMADAIAHHFNNQLDVVVCYLNLVLDVLPLGSDESERLIEAMKASHRAADVSRQMLTYLGQAPGKLELQDISETCHKGLLMLQAFIPKNVSVEPVIPFPGPTIRASMSQMHQIFTSLVTNAWESISDNKGTITISVKTVSAADISLSHRFPINWRPNENLYACLEVADTGSGITNADIDKVFDPFFTTKFVGRGLDLPVALGVVSAHGGGLTVESEVGKGSIFRVFLPVSAEAVSV